MGEVRLTHAARRDLIQISRYLATNAGASIATECLDRIKVRTAQLSQFPMSGRARPDIASDARSLVVDRWLVLYRIEAPDVRLLRIVDGARDLSSLKVGED